MSPADEARLSQLATRWSLLAQAHSQGDPAVSSAALAGHLSGEYGRPFTPGNVRQMIHRARGRFAELLRWEVATSLPSDDPAEVDTELAELGLLVYCPPGSPAPGCG